MSLLSTPMVVTIIFTFVMLAYWLGAFFILYHLIRFGVGTSPKRTAIIFLAGSLVLSIVLALLYGQLPFANIINI